MSVRLVRAPRGFALLTVLWVMVGIGVLALGASLAGRNALAAARNRAALADAQWKAEGCVERARAAAHDALTTIHPDAVIAAWDSLDRIITTSPYLANTSCHVTARAAGAVLDVNDVDAARLHRFFAALRVPPSRADSLTDALLDWRDADTVTRPLGAERAWYAAARRPPPRDGQLADPRELLRVRGFEHFGDTLALIGTDSARIPLSHAPLPVLASLPGLTPEALVGAADLRLRHDRIPELLALGATLAKDARETLLAHYAELARRTTSEPEGWIVTAEATAGTPVVTAVVEVRLARGGTRVAVLRRR